MTNFIHHLADDVLPVLATTPFCPSHIVSQLFQPWRTPGEAVNCGCVRGPKAHAWGNHRCLARASVGYFGVGRKKQPRERKLRDVGALGLAEKIMDIIDHRYPVPKP